MALDFVLDNDAFQWATYTPSRDAGQLRCHETKAKALASQRQYTTSSILFERRADEWVPVYQFDGAAVNDDAVFCEVCKIILRSRSAGNLKSTWFTGNMVWKRHDGTKKIADPPRIVICCDQCKPLVENGA